MVRDRLYADLVSDGMKVLLLTDVRGTGRKGDVKEVREGYARNFLIPRGLAEAATERTLVEKEARDAERSAARAARRRDAEIWATELGALAFTFPVKAGEKGEVFSSVTAREIQAELAARGYRGATVKLAKPLKALGDHLVEIDLGEGIKTTVTVTVVPAKV